MASQQLPLLIIMSLTLMIIMVSGNVFHLERVGRHDQQVVLDNITHPIKYYNSTPTFELERNLYPVFYSTKLRFGTPSKEQKMLLDTGSDDIWVNCRSSSGCPNSSRNIGATGLNIFDPESSSTSSLLSCSDELCSRCSENKCTYDTKYVGGSDTSGYYLRDELVFNVVLDGSNKAAKSSTPFVFGCSKTCSSDMSRLRVDGFLGLGRGSTSFVSQLSSLHKAPKVFSHCLKGDGSGGVLVFGEISAPTLNYTPLVPSPSHYVIKLESISLNGQELPVAHKYLATNVDTGTETGLLAKEIFDPLVNAISAAITNSATPTADETCYNVFDFNRTLRQIFPTISFKFKGGVIIVLRPEEYLIMVGLDGDTVRWCFTLARSSSTNIIGVLFLLDKVVSYDLSRNRAGFANYNCSLPIHVDLQASSSSISKDSNVILNVFQLCIVVLLLIMHF